MEKTTKHKKKTGWILYAVFGISLLAVIIFAVSLARELYINKQGRNYYSSMTNSIETRQRSFPENTTDTVGRGSRILPNGSGRSIDSSTRIEDEEEDEYLWLPYVDFESLDEQYPGISAWIQLEGTSLDYPIMRWTDNSFFLSHLPDGSNHRNGSVFLDFRNSPDFSDINTLIYAHTAQSDDMFGILKNYRVQSFYEENPVMYIFTPYGDFELVLFAGYLLDSGYETPPLNFADEDAFENHVADIKRRSVFFSDVTAQRGDRIVSLCTCAYDYNNARLIIVGKLVEF